jgi:phosphoglycerol transferase MdoB-like AlkP superfamily enzyme
LSAGFRHIVEGKDISGEIPSGRLGVHDGYLLDLHAGHAAGFPKPFFSVVFTLSSHSPYDQPMEPVLEWGTTEDQFINSAYYTDRSLGEYFDKARKQPWFENTLFVILADHSHNSYRNWPLESFEYHKVPLLLCGGALKDEWRGKTIGRISSNIDVAVTLLGQLGMGRNGFGWGNDLFNPASPEFAFFEINDGVGWKTPEGEFVYNKPGDRYYALKYADGLPAERQQKLIRDGRSYIQVLFQSFLDM